MEFYCEISELDGEVHFLKQLDNYVQRILCYPQSTCHQLEARARRLIEDGFTYFLSTGTSIQNLRVLGKGYSSIVTVAYNERIGIGSLKLLRIDSRRDNLLREAEFMKLVEDMRIAPRVLLYRDFYVFYELLPPHRCQPFIFHIDHQVRGAKLDELKRSLHSVLWKLFMLDMRRIDHTELNRPGGHILYCDGEIKIIDWESARRSPRPTNLSSFVSFLLFRYHYAERLRELLGLEPANILANLRIYKERYDEDSYGKLIESMSLRDVETA